MNQKLSVLVILILLVFPLSVLGQRPGKGGKMQRGNAIGQGAAASMGRGGNQAMMMANQAMMGGQQGGGQNMPSVDQLAQMMLASFDADGSGALDQAELQNALTGLRAMMMQNRGQGAQGGQMGAKRAAFNQNAAGQRPANGGQQGRRGAGRNR